MSDGLSPTFLNPASSPTPHLSYASPLDDPRFMALVRNNKIAFYCDADGSLGVYKPAEHDNVQPDIELQNLLSRMLEIGLAVCINTGRPQLFIDRILPEIAHLIPIATEHGALVKIDSITHDMVSDPQDILALRKKVAAQFSDIPACIVEDHKTRSMTIGCTNCTDMTAFNRAVAILTQIATVINNAAKKPILCVKQSTIPGNVVVDLLHVGADKDAACAFISQTNEFNEKIPVAVIDSSGDKSMAAWVKEQGGFVIIVGSYTGVKCDFRVKDPAELRSVLNGINAALSPEHNAKEAPTPAA